MKLSILGIALVATLLLAPVAHADTGFVPIGDPETDTLQLWSEIAVSIELIARDAASEVGQVTSAVQHLASAVTAPHPTPSGGRPHTPKQLPSAITQAASVAAVALTDAATATQSEQNNSTEPQQSQSRSPPTTNSSAIVYQLSQTPAFDTRDFVTQVSLSAQLRLLSNTLSAEISAPPTLLIPQYVAAGGNNTNPFAASNAIDQLSGTTLNNVTVDGVSGLTASEIPDLSATYLPLTGGAVTGNLTVSGSFTGGSISLSSASSTNASSTNLFSSNAAFTNATSTNFFAAFANFTSAVATTFNASVANIVGLTATNSTTTNATTTNLYAAVATIPSLTGTTATFSGATSTSLFATTASSTNLFAQTASVGSLTLPALSGLLEGNGSSAITAITGTAGQFPYYSGTNALLATSTVFLASNGAVGIGTSTPGSLLSLGGIANFTTSTSTFYSTGGINLAAGCFAIGGNCLTLGSFSGTLGIGNGGTNATSYTTGQLLSYNGTSFVSTSTIGNNQLANSSITFTTGSSGSDINWTSSPVSLGGTATLNIPTASASVRGLLASADWTNFNNKVSSSSLSGASVISYTSGTGVITTTPGTFGGSGTYVFPGFVNTNSTTGGYQIDGNLILQASSTNKITAVGQSALASYFNTSSTAGETALGYQALENATSSTGDTAVGYQALAGSNTISNAGQNTAVGYKALFLNSSGSVNTAVGYLALAVNTTGSDNVAVGNGLHSNQTGGSNSAVGYNALNGNTTGGSNTAFGYNALNANNGVNNTAVGAQSLQGNITGGSNAALGGSAELFNNSATDTVTVGAFAGYGNEGNYHNQGGVLVGYLAGYDFATSSDYNTLIGYKSGSNITTGADNILIGADNSALNGQPGTNNNLTTGSGNISLGYNISLPSATGNNQLDIGNEIYGTGLSGTGSTLSTGSIGIGTTSPYARLEIWGPDTASTTAFTVVNSASTTAFAVYDNGNATYLGSIFQSSDQRLKTDIQSLDASSSLAAVEALNPVSYLRLDQPSTGENLGFIAQQVQSVFPQLVSTTSPTSLTPDGTLTLNYLGLVSPIVSAIQALEQQLTSLANTVADFANSFTTNELTFNRATGAEADVQTLCLTDGPTDQNPVCVNKAQLAAILAATNAPQSTDQRSAATPDASTTPDTPPVIQINGDNPAIVQVGNTYNDLGATVTGPQADLNLGITTYVNGAPMNPIQLDTSEAATDTIDYVATDQTGLTSTSTRTVIVEAPSIVPTDGASTTSTSASSQSEQGSGNAGNSASSTDATSTAQ